MQNIIAPPRHHNVNDHEIRFISPVATPRGIPIIKPNPSRKEGAIAMSGLLARENRTVNSSSAKKSRGLIRKLNSSDGNGRIKFPATGIIANELTANKIISVEMVENMYPGKNMAMLLPIHISIGLNVVAKRDSMLPSTFSLIIVRLAKAQTASAEIQIAESTVPQSSQQQQSNNESYEKWECIERGCDYIYDPAIGDATQGIAPGTKFEDLPADWLCPVCKKGKDHFVKL